MLNYDSALCCLSDHLLSHRAATIAFVTLGTSCSLMLQEDLLGHSMISKLSKEHNKYLSKAHVLLCGNCRAALCERIESQSMFEDET